jgi:hypothetical protein
MEMNVGKYKRWGHMDSAINENDLTTPLDNRYNKPAYLQSFSEPYTKVKTEATLATYIVT